MAARRSFVGNCSIISHHHHEVQNFGAAVVCLFENVYTQRSFKFPFIHRVAWNDLKIAVEKYDKHNFVDFFNFDII